jgi:hypothetical protein
MIHDALDLEARSRMSFEPVQKDYGYVARDVEPLFSILDSSTSSLDSHTSTPQLKFGYLIVCPDYYLRLILWGWDIGPTI